MAGKEFLVKDNFSVADVAVCSYLLFIPLFHPNFDASRFPNVVRCGACHLAPSNTRDTATCLHIWCDACASQDWCARC